MLKKTIYFALSLFLLTGTMWAEDYSFTTERTFEIQGRPELVLRNPDGVIQIIPREGSTVEIKITRQVHGAKSEADAKKSADSRISLELEQTGNQVRAITRWPSEGIRIGWRPGVKVRFEVWTPAASNVRAEVSDGELYVSGLEGELELDTSDGEILASDLSGSLRISGSDGDINLKNCTGTMDIHLSDGDLRAENCSGRVRIESGDGNIELPGFDGEIEVSNVDGEVLIDGILKSMNGRIGDGQMQIRVAPGSVMQSAWSLRSGDGEIVLDLPDDFSADLEVSTGDGHVETDHPVSVVGSLSSRRLTGKIRDGGFLLQIKSGDGNIAIK
ncbi:DUF4097 domain-containing protein [bacterium]|nr:DUF4097 domain-containing protein [bacterium]